MSKAVLRNYRYRRFLRSIWRDNPSTVQTGWTDNGDGSYTCDGTNGVVVRENVDAGTFADGGNYEVKFEITAYTSGSFRMALYGPDDVGVGTTRTALGVYKENVNIDTGTGSAANNIILQSISSFNGTVANISVRELDRP